MAPRLPGPQGLRSLTLCLRSAVSPTPSSIATPSAAAPAALLQPLTQTASLSMREKKKKMRQDPYGWAQAQQRKNASLERRREIEAARQEGWGDPIHGLTTPFVESFDSAGQAPHSKPQLDADGNPIGETHELPTSPHLANFLLDRDAVARAVELSEALTRPLAPHERTDAVDPARLAEETAEHLDRHARAVLALERITSLENSSAKDRKHANIRRCIETFGRHVTDKTLERPARLPAAGIEPVPKPPRAGPDTGSSEVQIAILTAKIRAVAQMLESPAGKKDKNNKRSLQRLCHRRQALLRYMERKERGSQRWHHMIQTLGLSPATWKEQISI